MIVVFEHIKPYLITYMYIYFLSMYELDWIVMCLIPINVL